MRYLERLERLMLIVPMALAPFVAPHIALTIAICLTGAALYSLLSRK